MKAVLVAFSPDGTVRDLSENRPIFIDEGWFDGHYAKSSKSSESSGAITIDFKGATNGAIVDVQGLCLELEQTDRDKLGEVSVSLSFNTLQDLGNVTESSGAETQAIETARTLTFEYKPKEDKVFHRIYIIGHDTQSGGGLGADRFIVRDASSGANRADIAASFTLAVPTGFKARIKTVTAAMQREDFQNFLDAFRREASV